MRKTAIFLLYCSLFLAACQPGLSTPTFTSSAVFTPSQTPRPTVTPSATLPPCPESQTIGEITIVFHEKGISDKDCDVILKYVGLTVDKFTELGQSTGPVGLNVFATAEAVTDFEYDWLTKANCNPEPKAELLKAWAHGGPQASGGAAFFLTTGWWRQAHPLEKPNAIAHELVHLVQFHYMGSCQRMWTIPNWYTEGQAEHFANAFTKEWGFEPEEEELYRCEDKLAELSPSNGDCVYMEAQMAFIVLRDSAKYGGGNEKSFDVLLEMANGRRSFAEAFYKVYGVSVSEFSDDFDRFRLNNYRLPLP